MKEAPEPVLLYIPLMKELNMSWGEIKNTPRVELEGLLIALGQYQTLHSLDGYDSKDVSSIAKDKPQIKSQWAQYQQARAKYYRSLEGKQKKSFQGLLG